MAKFKMVKQGGRIKIKIMISREPEDYHFWEQCTKFYAGLKLALDDACIDEAIVTHDYVSREEYTVFVSVPACSSAKVDKIIDTTKAKHFEKQESGVG